MLILSKSDGSHGQYLLMLLFFWVYSMIWIGALLAICLSDMRLSYKVAVGILLALVTPDVDSLFMSYKKYLNLLNSQKRQ